MFSHLPLDHTQRMVLTRLLLVIVALRIKTVLSSPPVLAGSERTLSRHRNITAGELDGDALQGRFSPFNSGFRIDNPLSIAVSEEIS